MVSLLTGKRLWEIALTRFFLGSGPDSLASSLSVATQRNGFCPCKEVCNSVYRLGKFLEFYNQKKENTPRLTCNV